MTTDNPITPDSAGEIPIESDAPSSGCRPFILGGVAVLLAAILGADEVRDPSGSGDHGDLQMAIPVPPGTRLVVRSLDPGKGRSIAVLDLAPATPPDWTDTVVVVRRRALPGVMVGYATRPVDLPAASDSIDRWRAFAAGNAVRVDHHRDLRAALSALVELTP